MITRVKIKDAFVKKVEKEIEILNIYFYCSYKVNDKIGKIIAYNDTKNKYLIALDDHTVGWKDSSFLIHDVL